LTKQGKKKGEQKKRESDCSSLGQKGDQGRRRVKKKSPGGEYPFLVVEVKISTINERNTRQGKKKTGLKDSPFDTPRQ